MVKGRQSNWTRWLAGLIFVPLLRKQLLLQALLQSAQCLVRCSLSGR